MEEKIKEKLQEHGCSVATATALSSETCAFLQQRPLPYPVPFSSRHPREVVLAALICMEVASQLKDPAYPLARLRDLLSDLVITALLGQLPLSEAPSRESLSGAHRLLLVDDDTNLRASLADFLRSLGYQVETASTGEEALEYLALSSYDAILTDVVLPGIDGWELAQEIREQNLQPVVLLFSGWRRAPSEDEERMRLVDGFVEKPVDPQALANLLQRLLLS